MKRLQPIRVETSSRRGGAVIVVVLTLMTSLAFIGLFFYTLADNELSVATAFEKKPDQVIDPDGVSDFALQQVLVSTPSNRPRSPLHGGIVTYKGNRTAISDKSLLAHVIGLVAADGTPVDVRPRNGRGIGVYGTNLSSGQPKSTASGEIDFDYNGDYDATNAGTRAATREATGTDFRLNFSSLTSGTGAPFDLDVNPRFIHLPDVDYTYPDVNSLFLSYDTVLPNGTRVVIPSYQRPQLFPDYRTAGFATLYTDPQTLPQVLRPHALSVYNVSEDINGNGSLDPGEDLDGDGSISAIRRYAILPGGTVAHSGDRNRIIAPFSSFPSFGSTAANQMGVFSSSAQYELDVDADGDGVLDSIWLDLDHPIVDLADGRQAVPMFYVKVIDMDALLNVNHHGHDPRFTFNSNNAAADAFSQVYGLTNAWIHASNQGASPAEVNPLPALYADPASANDIDQTAATVAAATLQHRGIFADNSTGPPTDRTPAFNTPDSTSRIRMANAELFRLLHGSPEYRSDLSYANSNAGADIPGRYGEAVTANGLPAQVLRNALLASGGSGVFPSAGDTRLYDDDGDDNNPSDPAPPAVTDDNFSSGRTYPNNFYNLLSNPLVYPYSVHPRDFTGLGQYAPLGLTYSINPNLPANIGAVRYLAGLELSMPINPSRWLYYGTRDMTTSVLTPAAWQDLDNGVVVTPGLSSVPWSRGANPGSNDRLFDPRISGTPYDGLLNENDELVADANFPTQVDAPFPPSELAALHPSDQQWQLIRDNSRLRKLASFNFEASRRAAAIRQQFTTDSRDRLEHGHHRPFTEDTNFNGMLDPGEDTNGNGVLDAGPRYREFNDVTPSSGLFRFPPRFGASGGLYGTGITSRHELITSSSTPIDAADPFRPVVRRLLTTEENNQFNIGGSRNLPGQKLNLNRLLVNFDRNGNPIYRRLTPHVSTFVAGDSDSSGYLLDAGGNVRPASHANPTTYDGSAPITQAYYTIGDAGYVYDPHIPAPPSGTFNPVPFTAIDSTTVPGRFAQEAWARYDRQRLARDIYTLLYTLGAPDTLDVTTNPYPIVSDANQNGIDDLVEAMAQFAVNYVDGLDPDDVITRFEFDADLSNGWDTTTSPWPVNAVVYGVEAQQLTLSEAYWIKALKQMSDFTGTIYRDDDQQHQFLYIELRNATPFTVPLPTDSYRIVRVESDPTFTMSVGVRSNAVEFKTNSGGLYKQVGPGENFLVGTHDGSITVHQAGSPSFGQVRAADFYLNTDTATPEFEANVPNGPSALDPNTQPAPVPLTDLDLCHPQDTEFHTDRTLNDLTTLGGLDVGLGTKLVGLANPTQVETKTSFVLVLERQLNTHAAGVLQKDNWVEVDRMWVQGADFAPTSNAVIADPMNTPLKTMKSGERRQPLTLRDSTNERTTYPITPNPPTTPPTVDWMYRYELNPNGGLQNHTLDSQGSKHGPNSQQAAAFDVWQPHFDRDLTSVYDLLSVPVITPVRLVEQLTNLSGKLSGKYPSINALIAGELPTVAGQYFRNPDGDANDNNVLDGWETPNRWYRLLEFVEIPPRANDTVRDGQMVRRRTDGRINLNTLRHEPVLAGLIDDTTQLQDTSAARPALDRLDAGRNWFEQLLYARDGIDPISSLPLPGVPGSMPFRSLSYVDPQPNGGGAPDAQLENTLLRLHHPYAATVVNAQIVNEGLFEARGTNDVLAVAPPSTTKDNVDYYTRNRLLSKIANNTTNRSHVFAIWVGYELFEAHQPNPNVPDVVQIGARIEDLPGHREFVVADMTRLEEAFVDDPTDVDGSGNAIPGRFDWRKFIIYRKRIK